MNHAMLLRAQRELSQLASPLFLARAVTPTDQGVYDLKAERFYPRFDVRTEDQR